MQAGAFRPVATGQDKLDVPFIAFVHFALIVVAIGQGQHGREQVKDISSGMKTIMLTGCPKQAGARAATGLGADVHGLKPLGRAELKANVAGVPAGEQA